jgi:hypothetical protein
MHAARADKSFRLQRCLEYIKSAGPNGATTAEIQAWTHSMAPATDISEIRHSGYIIERTYEGRTRSGRQVNRYTYRGRTFQP